MKFRPHLRIVLALFALSAGAIAQSDSDVSLGDLARSLRKSKDPEPAKVIDNDNLTQVIEQVESLHVSKSPLFSFKPSAKSFEMSSPDGTCSLSFNANATVLLANPYAAQDLPQEELAKLDGPASLEGDTLQISIYNGSSWSLREITVGVTILRPASIEDASFGAAKLVPAVEEEESAEKYSDQTLLLHLKGGAAPSANAMFREKLTAPVGADQQWHWAVISAKGIPPESAAGAP